MEQTQVEQPQMEQPQVEHPQVQQIDIGKLKKQVKKVKESKSKDNKKKVQPKKEPKEPKKPKEPKEPKKPKKEPKEPKKPKDPKEEPEDPKEEPEKPKEPKEPKKEPKEPKKEAKKEPKEAKKEPKKEPKEPKEPKEKCKGTTKTGSACKKLSCDANGFCKVHSQKTQDLFSYQCLLDQYDIEEKNAKEIMNMLERFTKDVLEKVNPTTKSINREAIYEVKQNELGMNWLEGIKGENNYAFITLSKHLSGSLTKLNSKLNQVRKQKWSLGKEAKEELIAYLSQLLQSCLSFEDIHSHSLDILKDQVLVDKYFM